MVDNYTVLHLHSMDSNPKSGLTIDSVTPFQDYIIKAKECGMSAIAFTEHGSVLHNIAKKQMCEKNGIKYIHGQEFYVTEMIDKENLVRDNYHLIMLAKNRDGVREINYLSSIANNKEDGHFYYTPRIELSDVINTSENILILTACTAGILCRGTSEAKEKFLTFVINNKNRCWLEIQPHLFDTQIEYNQNLYQLSKEYNISLVATSDVHAVSKIHMTGRSIMQKAKKIVFHDEDQCDLTWYNYSEMVDAFNKQNALPIDVCIKAIQETNYIAELVEDYSLDYTNKYPRRKNSEEEFKRRIQEGIKEHGIDKFPDYETVYKPRIQEEFEAYKKTDAIDFMLLDSDYKNWMREHGMYYGPSRGSVSGSLIAYLIHSTDVDSIKYNLNFSRFMNQERQSLADIDADIYAEDRYKVREYFFNRKDVYCCNIVTFNTIKMRGAIKDIARAIGIPVDEAQKICNEVYEDENKKECVPDKIRKEYSRLFEYVDVVIGTITSLGRHAAGIVVSPTDIRYDFGTMLIESDPRPVSQIDMHEIDSLNFVKMDLLGLNAVGLINKACKLAGIPNLTPDIINFEDEKVIKSISEDTTMIFQFESGFASDSLKKTFSNNTIARIKAKNKNMSYLDIMAMVSGAIRPAGESYREALFNGEYHDNGEKVLNDFLAPTLGYLVYQEQIIDFLHKFCGFTMGQADIVRRGFSKKIGTEKYIPIIKDGGYMEDIHGNIDKRYIPGYINIVQKEYGMTKERAEKSIEYFLKVIEDASSYLFSKNHAVPYSMIGLYIGYLRYYYPLQLLTAALNVYKSNDAKMNEIKEYAKSKGIKIKPIRFGKSRADYFMDVEENAIYHDIESIKECNAKSAEELFELRNNLYNDFVDLLFDIIEKTSVNKTKLDILIKLDFFHDFGDISTLLWISEEFDKLYGKKSIKKDSSFARIIEDISSTERIYESETPTHVDEINPVQFFISRGITDIKKMESLMDDCQKYRYQKNDDGSRKKIQNGISFTKMFKKFSVTEEEKLKFATKTVYGKYEGIHTRQILKYLLKNSKLPHTSVYQRIQWQEEFLGYIDYTDPAFNKRYFVVTQLDTTYSPKFVAYCINNGKTAEMKVRKRRNPKDKKIVTSFTDKPFKDGDVLYLKSWAQEHGMKKVDDKWVENPDVLVNWLYDYDIVQI
jgi:DNA polymerase-3 subunit alpha